MKQNVKPKNASWLLKTVVIEKHNVVTISSPDENFVIVSNENGSIRKKKESYGDGDLAYFIQEVSEDDYKVLLQQVKF